MPHINANRFRCLRILAEKSREELEFLFLSALDFFEPEQDFGFLDIRSKTNKDLILAIMSYLDSVGDTEFNNFIEANE